MELSLTNKTAVIGGGSKGIGFAVAKELALLGADCVLLARNENDLIEAVKRLPGADKQLHSYYVVDFAHRASTEEIVRQIVSKGVVHVLVNNSGGPAAGPITEAAPEQFINAFHQHIVISHLFTTAFLPGMKAAGYGRIINIVSTSVKVPLKNLGVSNTTRGAMAGWAKTMANEVGRYGITVNNVLPGMTKTERLDALIAHTSKTSNKPITEVEASMQAEIPAARFGEAQETAALAAFLATPAASYVNGTSIPVDGGRTGAI